jgi:hypothetical protein
LTRARYSALSRERATSAIPANLERWRGDADSDDFAERERLLSDLERRLNG